jgi:copper resistance protein B
MKIDFRKFLLLMLAVIAVGVIALRTTAQDMPGMPMPTPKATPKPSPKQTPSPTPKPSPTPTPMEMPMDTPNPTTTPSPTPMQMEMPTPKPSPTVSEEKQTLPNLKPDKDFGEPVADNERYGSILFDVLEFRPGRGGNSDFRWDIEGWYGTDKNRFFYKSEGERNTAFKADYDIDLQFLYSRLISPYFNFQTGVRFETQTFRRANVTRPQAVVGFEGLAPYFIELESGIFIDPKGNVSGRLSLTKDFLFTNRLIMQTRFETNAAIQRVERFTTGKGLNNIELGFRFRYEYRRKFAPYFGVTFDRSFFETAKLVRLDGGDPSQIRFTAGVRMFF